MLAIVQLIGKGQVSISHSSATQRGISNGLLVLLGVSKNDDESDVDKIVKKVSKLRIFPDKEEKMNLDIQTTKGSVLLISQFTLFGNVKKCNRPDFMDAADKNLAIKLYDLFADKLTEVNIPVVKGYFGEHMTIETVLSGPVTIILDSKKI